MTVGAFDAFLLCAILDKFLEGAANTVAPRVDALLTEVEAGDNVDHVVHGDSVAQQGGGHLGIVPELLVKTTVKAAEDHLITGFVQILEVV